MKYILKGKVFGRVQKVSFRAFTKDIADSLGIQGYVRNVEDGTVEFEAIGEKEALEMFLEKLKEGPKHAFVSDIKYNMEVFEDEDYPKSFDILY
ncbi:acylphosphatase [Hydrogenobaculum sp. Y04AAS1]|uniref:acylphosphatase n=1 Tax=Hydrogenobaculum sp. (strain Y04AAS1) TaxID=380749 RepID=UPI00015BD1BE|nr:acylphosphatase [Hydrogenobaculum sp. Y04AAS1]HCT67204.1 acylphosphatase [Hydrogenobaculum sp.]